MSFTIDESQQASVDDIHVVKDLLGCFAQARYICDKAGTNDLEVHILAAVALLQSLRAAAALELFGDGRQNRSNPKQNCLRGLVCQGFLGWQDHCHRSGNAAALPNPSLHHFPAELCQTRVLIYPVGTGRDLQSKCSHFYKILIFWFIEGDHENSGNGCRHDGLGCGV